MFCQPGDSDVSNWHQNPNGGMIVRSFAAEILQKTLILGSLNANFSIFSKTACKSTVFVTFSVLVVKAESWKSLKIHIFVCSCIRKSMFLWWKHVEIWVSPPTIMLQKLWKKFGKHQIPLRTEQKMFKNLKISHFHNFKLFVFAGLQNLVELEIEFSNYQKNVFAVHPHKKPWKKHKFCHFQLNHPNNLDVWGGSIFLPYRGFQNAHGN